MLLFRILFLISSLGFFFILSPVGRIPCLRPFSMVAPREGSLFIFFLFTIVLIKLLLLISDPVLSVGTANESVYAIFSLSEPEGMAVIVKEVGESMALVVWGEP